MGRAPSFAIYFSSQNSCSCPARAAGRLPGGGQGVRGVLPLYTPHTPRTPRNPGTRKVSFSANSLPPAARRVGRRREPSRPFGAGDVRACSGAPSALRASGIAFAPASRCLVGGNEGRPSLGRNRGKIRGRGRGRAGATVKVNGGPDSGGQGYLREYCVGRAEGKQAEGRGSFICLRLFFALPGDGGRGESVRVSARKHSSEKRVLGKVGGV